MTNRAHDNPVASTPYGTRSIAESTLERWPNPSPDRDYTIDITLPEFTCVCPQSGYPDFATIHVEYVPDQWIVELKSLKLYINSYRDTAVSHEAVANRVLNDLVGLLAPRSLTLKADFNPRGNVHTVVTVRHQSAA